MDSSPSPVPLRFDKASVPEESSALTCEFCQSTIPRTYYEVNGQTSCERCRRQAEFDRAQGSAMGKGFRALLGGGAGGLVGAGIYYAVLALTGYEIGLVAIVVGLLVGLGVRWGSGGVGGRGYQFLAVGITYVAIVSTYIPFIVAEALNAGEAVEAEAGEPGASATTVEESVRSEVPVEGESLSEEPMPETAGEAVGMLAVGLAFLLVIAMAAPFLAGIQNAIGLLIIGFALYEAWRVNAYAPLAVEGPFEIGTGASTST